MAAYIGGVFYATMVVSALIMDLAFHLLGWIPRARPNIRTEMVHFSIDYTFWLNILFGLFAVALVVLARRNPMRMPAARRGGGAEAAAPTHHHH